MSESARTRLSGTSERVQDVNGDHSPDIDVQLSAHIKYVLRHLPWVLGWYMSRPFRMLRFRRYVMAKRTLVDICARLTAKSGHETIVGFGH